VDALKGLVEGLNSVTSAPSSRGRLAVIDF
jgi:hypothetical protein